MIRVTLRQLQLHALHRPPGYAAELKPALVSQDGDVLTFDNQHQAWLAAKEKYAGLRRQSRQTTTTTRKPCGCGKK